MSSGISPTGSETELTEPRRVTLRLTVMVCSIVVLDAKPELIFSSVMPSVSDLQISQYDFVIFGISPLYLPKDFLHLLHLFPMAPRPHIHYKARRKYQPHKKS
jgi:hypothetical protein